MSTWEAEVSSSAERFRRDTAEHRINVLHDNGLYRHLRFSAPQTGMYWFDLVTWPGHLAIVGDMGSGFVFARTRDMFGFFRGGGAYGINPHYWSEKVVAGREAVRTYSQELCEQLVKEHVADAIRAGDTPRGLARAVRNEILDWGDLAHEEGAREALDDFEFRKWRFVDTWEWELRTFGWSFLWACHGITRGISEYDKAQAGQESAA